MTETEEKKAYAYCLYNLEGIGDRTLLRLLKQCEDPREIYQQLKEAGNKVPDVFKDILNNRQMQLISGKLHFSESNIRDIYERLLENAIDFLPFYEEAYPERLKNIPDPPFGLYVKGSIPKEEVLSVAVVGARDCSEYGRYIGQEIGKALGRRGIQVISGLARGIDGISQEAALEAGGSSFGVLGCGVDICYPASNRKLYERLQMKGGVLSTFSPGTMPKAQHFPPRNRIVSGLSDVLIVVEARNKSGTSITVDMALEQGRDIYVVPGRLTDRLSDGCNNLIKQGAGVFLSPEDFLKEMEEVFANKMPQDATQADARKERVDFPFDHLERKVYEGIDLYPRSIDQIKEFVGIDLSYSQMQQILTKLCLTSYVKQVSPGFYKKNASDTGFLTIFFGSIVIVY